MEKIRRVLLLDIDGPINPYSNIYYQRKIGKSSSSHRIIFPEHTLYNLKRIIDSTDAKIVISSSWRKDIDAMNNLKNQFYKYGLFVYDTTPISSTAIRGLECKAWLDNIYCITGYYPNYAIIDDEICDIVPYHKGHCVQTTMHYGLTEKLSNIAIQILFTPFKYRP